MFGIQKRELWQWMKHKELNIKKMKNIEKKQEQIQNYRDKVAFCNVCNSSIKVQCYSRHLKTNKHKRNLGIVDG